MSTSLRPWLLGITVALLVAGPALAPGILLNLDLVVTHDLPVPTGVWGLGPELPRQVPYVVPMAWLSTVLDGALVGKAVMLAALTLAFVGAHRLAAGAPPAARIAAGLVYAAGPFLVTRLAIGHLGTALAAAVLPWALPTLLRPGESLRRTLLWSAALGACGVNGGILVGIVLLVALVADRGRRAPAVLGVALVGQLPWLVPGVIVSLQGVSPAGAEAFDTRLDGPLGLLRLTAGQGYFIGDFDIGGGRLAVPIAALGLLVLAVAGHRRLPAAWAARAAAVAAVGLVLAAASGLPVVDGLYRAVADTALGLPLREGHRVLALFLVWMAPAAAMGSARLSTRPEIGGLVPLGLALALIGPSLWGFGGQLEAVPEPEEWTAARRIVTDHPGPVLALPWSQYLRPTLTDGRLVHQPLPTLFGGDVLLASGQGDDASPDERADPRQDLAGDLAAHLRAGESADRELAALGIRWVALVDTIDPSYAGLEQDPSFDPVVEGDDLKLYEVRSHPGAASDDEGRSVDVDTLVAPLASVTATGPVTWFRPGATGWLRGLEPASVSVEGNLGLPDAAGPVWYWPSLLVLAADGITVGAVVLARRRDR